MSSLPSRLRKMQMARPGLLLGLAMSAACQGPSAVAEPTWADVAPILVGQCGHCHGSTGDIDGYGHRLDFANPARDCARLADADPRFFTEFNMKYGGLKQFERRVVTAVEPLEGLPRPLMPPAPARLLEDWQRETLDNFMKAQRPRGPAPAGNAGPTISATARRDGSVVEVDYVVADPNGDPVLGVLRLGGMVHRLWGAGAGRVRFDVSQVAPGTDLAVSASLCDGWRDNGAVFVRTRDAAGNDLPVVTVE